MPPRVLKKNVGTNAQKKTGAKAPGKTPKTSAEPVSSTLGKPEPEAVEKAQSKPSPSVEAPKAEEKAIEPFQDSNKPSIEAEMEKDIPAEDANKEINESLVDFDKPSAEESEEIVKGLYLENNETDAVMHEVEDNDGKDIKEHRDEQSDGDEAADRAGYHEEDVEGDGSGDEQHDVETEVKERIKQKEFEVFVGGLDKDADEDDLKKVFREVGEVVEIRLAKNPLSQKNRGFGFVRFATVEQATKAVAELKNPQVRGKQCEVTRNQDNETLKVRNICKSWTREALEKKLKQYGLDNIEEITLMEDPQHEGTNKGFAFLEFPTHLEAANALKRLQKRDVFFGVDICAKVAFAKSVIEPDEEVMAQVKSIFVDGLPPSWDEDRVEEIFKKYGEIEKVELARNMPTVKRKDFGFISFTTREAALACIEGVNKNEVNEEDKKLTLKATLRKPQQKGRNQDKKVTLKATLRKPQQKGRSVKDGQRSGSGGSRTGRAPWVRGGGALDGRFRVHERRRPPGPTYARSDSRRIYREEHSYIPDRRGRPSARSVGTVIGRSSYHGAEYSESVPPYIEDTYSNRVNGMCAYNDGPIRDFAGVSGSKRPYSDVDDDFPYPGRHSRSRLDYIAGPVDSGYGGASRLGQDPQLGYGAGSRAGGIYSSDYLPRGNDIEGGSYPSVLARHATGGYGSTSYY